MENLKHLDQAARVALELPLAERIQHVLRDRFIFHERAQEVLDHIHFLRTKPKQVRATGLIVTGNPGAGKTMLAAAVTRRYGAITAAENQVQEVPVASITMTLAREAKALHNRVLAALGCPRPDLYFGSDRERMMLKHCREAKLSLLIVDEIQDILHSTPRQQHLALDMIKLIMNELQIPVVVLGIHAAADAMRLDAHLNARFDHRRLPDWAQDEYLVRFLDAYERTLPLKQKSHLSTLPSMKALLNASQGSLWKIVRCLSFAAAHAIEQGTERITPALIEIASKQAPKLAPVEVVTT